MEKRIIELEKEKQTQNVRKEEVAEILTSIKESIKNFKQEVKDEIKVTSEEMFKVLKEDQKKQKDEIQQIMKEIEEKNEKRFSRILNEEEKCKQHDTNDEIHPIQENIKSLEKQQLHEWRMKQAVEAIPKFDGTPSMFNIWRSRLMEVMEEFAFLEKKSYVKYQMMVDRMTQNPIDKIQDLAYMEKPFESALDRLDRQFKQSSTGERIMLRIQELAQLKNENKEKWKALKLHLDSVNVANSEHDLRSAINSIVVFVFDGDLKEKWNNFRIASGEDEPTLTSMRRFLEKVYEQTPEKRYETNQKEPEKTIWCYFCSERHGLKCKKLAEMNREERIENVKKLVLCFNCLHPNHIAK